MDVIEDGTIDVCKTCGHQIVFELDDPTADDNPYGLWYTTSDGTGQPTWSSAGGTESCTPGPNDEDRYHEPEEE